MDLWAPLCFQAEVQQHICFDKQESIVFLCEPVEVFSSKQNTRGEEQFKLLSLHIGKWASETSCIQEGLSFCSLSAAGLRKFSTSKINHDENATNWTPAHEPPLRDSGDIRKPGNKNSGKHQNASDAILPMAFKRCLFYIWTKHRINSTQRAIKPQLREKNLMEKTDIQHFFWPYFTMYRTNINQCLISSVFLFSCCFINFSLSSAMTFWQLKIIYSGEKTMGARRRRNHFQAWFLLPLNML